MAANVEHELTRDQLLASYLNVAYFENQAYGIQVAAERYFNTTAHKLTLPEAAMLAGMVENPTADDPFTEPHHATQPAQRGAGPDGPAQVHHQAAGRGGREQPS